MAKKVILKDDNVEIMPITRGELVLDSSGQQAFHSSQFLATQSQPGLMSGEDKTKLDSLEKVTVEDKKVEQVNTTTNNSYRILFSNSADDTTKTEGARKSAKLLFNPSTGALTATALIGKLDWSNLNDIPENFTPAQHIHNTSEITALTSYSKASSASDLVTTDTLNAALGKLEYKADTAYDWIISVTTADTDKYINKWQEILDFLNAVDNSEGADITDEFVTRKTGQTITGEKIFSGTSESLLTIDRNSTSPAWIKFAKNNTLLGYIGIDNSKKVAANIDGTVHYILHSGNSHIKDGVITINGATITPITSHQSLANYVTLNGKQDITGEKTFKATIKAYDINPVTNNTYSLGTSSLAWKNIYATNGNFSNTVNASGFVKKDSSDSYVLLGGGGHKVLSDFAMASAYVKKAGDTMTGRLTMTGEGIIVTTATTSNYRTGVEFYKGTAADTTYSYDAQIGWHNTGGDGTGSICILPYATSTQPWGGNVGLFITKTDLKYNGVSVWHAGNDGSGSGLDADLLDGKHLSSFITYELATNYVGASFNSEDLSKKAASTYIEYWDGTGGWFNSRWGQVQAISGFHRVGSSDSYVLLGGGGHKLESNLSVNYAASTGNADTVDGYHASSFFKSYGTYGSGNSYDSDWGQSVVTFDPVVSGTYPENNPNITILNLGNNYARRKQLACMYNNNNIYYRRRTDSSWSGWVRLAIAGESYTKGDSDGRYYPISGNVNMSGDNKWIGSTMGGGTDYWRIGGSGTSDNGVCQITIGDNSNDYFQIVIADYTGTNYTALQVKAGGTYAPHFYENSDQRLKENIQAIFNKDNIPQIKEFDWKESGEHSYGLIAQELEEQGYSELVSTKDDGYKTVNYSAALSLIVGKLQVKIKELEKEIEILKNKN